MFDKIIKTDAKFLAAVLILAFAARMILAPLYISLPGEAYSTIPHDFTHYVDDAKAVLEGKILYVEGTHSGGKPTPYGPLFILIVAGILKIFGENYLILKMPAILFDMGIIVVVFHMARNLFGQAIARYATIFYAFSLISLLISGADATADLPVVFFIMASLFYMTKKNPDIFLSAIFLALSTGFKAPPALIAWPLIGYYFLRTNEFKRFLPFTAVFIAAVIAMNLPFIIEAGANVLIQITYGLQDPIGGTSVQSVANILVNYFIYGIDEKTRLPNPVISTLAFPILLAAGTLTSAYILKFGLEDKRVELIRNYALVIIVLATFVRMSHWHIFFWGVPFILMLAFREKRDAKPFAISGVMMGGIALIMASSIIYASLYRWTKIPEYSFVEQTSLIISIITAAAGTFLMMGRNSLKRPWTFSTFSWNLWLTDHAKPFMIFGTMLPSLGIPTIAFGVQHFVSIVFVVVSNLLLLFFVHKISKG